MSRRHLLIVVLILLLLPAFGLFWVLHTESGARWVWARAEAATDNALQAEQVAGDLTSGIVISGFEYGSSDVNVSIAEVAAAFEFSLRSKRVTVNSVRVSGVLVELSGERDAEENTDLSDVLATLELPVEVVIAGMNLDGARINGASDGSRFDIATASLAGRWQDTIRLDRFDVTTPEFAAAGTGSLVLTGEQGLAANFDLSVLPPLTGLEEAVQLHAELSGPIDDLAIALDVEEPEASVHGRVRDITTVARWHMNLVMSRVSSADFGVVPALPPAAVEAELHGDFETFVAAAEVAFLDTDMEVSFDAEIDFNSTSVAGDLVWQNTHWPIGVAEPQIHSRTGSVRVTGTLDDWTAVGTTELDVPQLPPGSFRFDARGSRDQVSAQILNGDVLGGSVAGTAEYTWVGPQNYAAEVELAGIHTAALLPDLPAELSGKLTVAGQQEPFQLTVELEDVSGELRHRSLFANGRVEVEGQAVAVHDLMLQHGETNLTVDGTMYGEEGLSYTLTVDELSHYIQDASGAIAASGSLSLQPGAQFLRIDASSEEFGYQGLTITNFGIADHGEENGVLDIEVTAESVSYGEMSATDLQLQTAMTRQSQTFQLGATSGGLRIEVLLEGVLDSWDQPGSWTGKLTKLALGHAQFSAALAKPVTIALTAQSAEVGTLCLVGEPGFELCAEGAWGSGAGSNAVASLSSVPVNLVNAFVQSDIGFNQLLSGEFNWQAEGNGVATGRSDITITAGKITSAEDPQLQLMTGPGRLGFEIDGDSLRSGVVDLPLPGLGHIAAEFEIHNTTAESAPEIAGLVDVDVADIGALIVFFPAVDEASGTLHADLDISGTTRAPSINGDIALSNGTLSYLPIGLKLSEMELISEIEDSGEFDLNGSLRAGDGKATIRTRAASARSATTGLEFSLRGTNLTLIDVPDIKAVADTDINVTYADGQLSLGGNVLVPRARVRPEIVGATPVYESDDVQLVAGELPDEPEDDSESADLQIYGSMEIAFGDDVVVDVGVAETRVTGKSVFTWSGEPMPVANGRYDVTGEILAFGQRLEITQGAVRFPDVSADDPVLRIRAEREIFGNTQVRRAGVLVEGTLSRPDVEAYTIPLTTEQRAVTLLVTGSDFDYERGIGAVDFGTYVAPRVYASYGIGLFDNENVIRLRYDLKKGIGITGTSGQKESGVDLSYRFEN